MRRRYPDEVEQSAMPRPEVDLPLFAPLSDDDYPKRKPVRLAEQREIPLSNSYEAHYQAWRQTGEGIRAYAAIRDRALRDLSVRIAVKRIVEDVRGDLRIKINNSFAALIARELRDTEPSLRHRIELRERSAA